MKSTRSPETKKNSDAIKAAICPAEHANSAPKTTRPIHVPSDFASLPAPMATISESDWLHCLARIRELMPIQNPLAAFLHNNMLMAWENQPFWPAVIKAAGLYGARVPGSTDYYRQQYAIGRIAPQDLEHALLNIIDGRDLWLARAVPNQPWARFLRLLLERSDRSPASQMLDLIYVGARPQTPKASPASPTSWQISEQLPTPNQPLEELFSASVHDWLCHSLESFLDQGLAYWANPFHDRGFLTFLKAWAASSWGFATPWQKRLATKLLVISQSSRTEILARWHRSSLTSEAWTNVSLNLLYTVKGWAGMLNKAETDPSLMRIRQPHALLEDLLLVLLILAEDQSVSLEELAHRWESCRWTTTTYNVSHDELVAICASIDPGRPISSLKHMQSLVEGLNALDEVKCRIIWHNAFEQSLHATALSYLSKYITKQPKVVDEPTIDPIVLCCIDDREESFRRHIETTEPNIRTFGVLGNFGLDMRFKGRTDPLPTQQCPPVITPRRVIYEIDRDDHQVSTPPNRRSRVTHALIGDKFYASRTLVRGYLTSLIAGLITAIPMVVRIMAPHFAQRLASRILKHCRPTIPGSINLHRHDHPAFGPCGYDAEEQAEIVYSILSAIAPIKQWPSIVLALGHESHSVNNPFLKAYGCGACSGHSGAPNARIFAQMANTPVVRAILEKMGINLPDTTVVIGGVHDTTSDVIRYFVDDQTMSSSQHADFIRLKSQMETALNHNAQERSVLFTGRAISSDSARRHVAERAINLAETRPEYGHSRTFLAIFGRRQLTRSISLDRRSFLISYDQAADPKGDILRGLIQGAMPVVANITLDYLFSRLDNQAFGSGSKLPLNIAGLLGVVTGSRGDLRIGLSEQMVDVHEPARSLVLIEADLNRIETAVFSHTRLNRLVTNGWLRMGAIDRTTGDISIWTAEGWRQPHLNGAVDCLLDWAQRSQSLTNTRSI